MNQREWMELQAATKGHKENPLGDCDPEGTACIVFCAGWTDADVSLAAAAPYLLAEVERLRGWIAFAGRNIKDEWLQRIIAAALTGAEVPK